MFGMARERWKWYEQPPQNLNPIRAAGRNDAVYVAELSSVAQWRPPGTDARREKGNFPGEDFCPVWPIRSLDK